MFIQLVLILIFSFTFVHASYEENLEFTIFQKYDHHVMLPNVFLFKFHSFISKEKVSLSSNASLKGMGCETNKKLAIVTHGWRENITSSWVSDIVGNLTEVRSGCIIFLDYSFYSDNPLYFQFINEHFKNISQVLTAKLKQFEAEGFNPDDLWMFGHSAGARLVIDAAANFGYQKVKEIDVCEPAGPGFDFKSLTMNPQNAAKNVACVHTSTFAGTSKRLCHQDWLMGLCGNHQKAVNLWKLLYCSLTNRCDTSYYYSHGLCPHFYNSAFKNDFFAVDSAFKCGSNREPTEIPPGFKMGYMESRKSSKIVGNFFAPTARHSPWNVIKR